MSPTEVREAVKPLGLPIDFSGACKGRGPAGRVVFQLPQPRGQIHFNEIRVWMDHRFSCERGSAKSPCGAGDLKIDVAAHESYSADHTAKALELTVENASSQPCQLKSTAVGRLRGPQGTGGAMRGNPWQITFDERLNPGEKAFYVSTWAGWCDKREKWRQSVRIMGLRARSNVWTPGCGGYWTSKSHVS